MVVVSALRADFEPQARHYTKLRPSLSADLKMQITMLTILCAPSDKEKLLFSSCLS